MAWDPLYSGHSRATRFTNYLGLGMMGQIGLEPHSVTPEGHVRMRGFGGEVETRPGSIRGHLNGFIPDWDDMTMGQRAMHMARGTLSFGMSGFMVYQGWQEGGFWGAHRMAITDLAANAGAMRFAYGSPGHTGWNGYGARNMQVSAVQRLGIKQASTMLSHGSLLNLGARHLGGNIGAQIGYSVGAATMLPGAATAGALVGGYIGAAPLRFAAGHLVATGTMLAAGAVASIGYGVYQVSKRIAHAGYQYSQMQRGVDTSGSLAAFMTQGATTMRARAVQAMHRSHINARSALGQEASFLHFPQRNYHSRYR